MSCTAENLSISPDRLDPAFAPRLSRFDLPVIDASHDVAYGLTEELRVAYVNQAWASFAAANGASTFARQWPLGRSIVEAWPTPLRDYYLERFETCRSSQTPWSHEYECSSPTGFRLFHQTVYPLVEGGFFVVHALREEHRLDAPDHAPTRARFEDGHGIITMCSHCRRVRDVEGRWRRVSAWVRAMPPRVSHGLCQPCFGFYFGDL